MAKLFQQLDYWFRCIGVITGARRQTLILDAMTRAESVLKDLCHDVVLKKNGNITIPQRE
jgi:hypothetical protein